MPYISINNLHSGTDIFSLLSLQVTKEETLRAIERHVAVEKNVDKITNYIPDIAAFWLDDKDGMSYYYTDMGLSSVYDTMLHKWGDDYDYGSVDWTDCTVKLHTKKGDSNEYSDLRFIGFTTPFLARSFVELCEFKAQKNPGKTKDLSESIKPMPMADILRIKEAEDPNSIYYYLENFSDDGTTFCRSTSGMRDVYDMVTNCFQQQKLLHPRQKGSQVTISHRKKQRVFFSSHDIATAFMNFIE